MATNIVRFNDGDQVRWGVANGQVVSIVDGTYETTGDFLRDGRTALAVAQKAGANDRELSKLDLLSPITKNQQFLCQFTNYKSHIIEGGRKPEDVHSNVIFRKASSCISPPDTDIHKPEGVKLLDYEIEIGLVLGEDIDSAVDVTEQSLSDYIAGLVMVNDVSARDVQIPQVQAYKAKSFRTFGPVGPFLTLLTRGDFAQFDRLRLMLDVNGDRRQDAYASDMHFKPAETLSELSRIQDLQMGDLIATGTPGGTAIKAPSKLVMMIAQLLPQATAWKLFLKKSMKNPDYLQPNDEILATIRTGDGSIDLGFQHNLVVSG